MTIAEYETNRDEYTKYLLLCVRLKDWHGVSDAANDLRVLDAKFSVIEEGYKQTKYALGDLPNFKNPVNHGNIEND